MRPPRSPFEKIDFLVADYVLHQSFSINLEYEKALEKIRRRSPAAATDVVDEIASTKFFDTEQVELWGPLKAKTDRGSRCKLARFSFRPEDWDPMILNQDVRRATDHGVHRMTALGFIRSGVRRNAVTGVATVPRRLFNGLTSMLGRAQTVLIQIHGHYPDSGQKDAHVLGVSYSCIGQRHTVDCGLLEDSQYACDCQG